MIRWPRLSATLSTTVTGGSADIDVIAVGLHPSSSCVAVISVRDGLNLGHSSHFPRHPAHVEAGVVGRLGIRQRGAVGAETHGQQH